MTRSTACAGAPFDATTACRRPCSQGHHPRQRTASKRASLILSELRTSTRWRRGSAGIRTAACHGRRRGVGHRQSPRRCRAGHTCGRRAGPTSRSPHESRRRSPQDQRRLLVRPHVSSLAFARTTASGHIRRFAERGSGAGPTGGSGIGCDRRSAGPRGFRFEPRT